MPPRLLKKEWAYPPPLRLPFPLPLRLPGRLRKGRPSAAAGATRAAPHSGAERRAARWEAHLELPVYADAENEAAAHRRLPPDRAARRADGLAGRNLFGKSQRGLFDHGRRHPARPLRRRIQRLLEFEGRT